MPPYSSSSPRQHQHQPTPRGETVSDRLASGWEGTLVNLAQKLVTTIETGGTPSQPAPPPAPSLEEVLLEGSVPRRRVAPDVGAAEGAAAAPPATEMELLRGDFDAVLEQRTQLRARLVAEQERRERAEAELVSLGACWLGTDTQNELQRRAEAERQRGLDAARVELMREADQRVAKVRAEVALLQQRLGDGAPSALELRMSLREALAAELARERREARAVRRGRERASHPTSLIPLDWQNLLAQIARAHVCSRVATRVVETGGAGAAGRGDEGKRRTGGRAAPRGGAAPAGDGDSAAVGTKGVGALAGAVRLGLHRGSEAGGRGARCEAAAAEAGGEAAEAAGGRRGRRAEWRREWCG